MKTTCDVSSSKKPIGVDDALFIVSSTYYRPFVWNNGESAKQMTAARKSNFQLKRAFRGDTTMPSPVFV